MVTEPIFQFFRTIAVSAGPRLLTIQISAIFARMRIFNAKQLKIAFPVWAFFSERGGAKAHFDPGYGVIGSQARVFHVPEIFVSGD